MARFFDYEAAAREADIPPSDLAALETRVRGEYAGDEMLAELRLLRICTAVREGKCSLAEAMQPEKQPPAVPK